MARILVILLWTGALTGCSALSGSSDKGAARTVWSDGDQYVRLAPSERSAPLNSHPVRLDPAQVAHAFELLELKSGDKDAAPLFTPTQLDLLSTQIPRALAEAHPDQDVTFAAVGNFTGTIGLKEPMVTTGRVFFQDGSLNLILGEVRGHAHQLQNTLRKDDPRLDPYVPGRRAVPTTYSGELLTPPNGLVAQHDPSRRDWLVFAPAAMATSTVPGSQPALVPVPVAGVSPSAPATTVPAVPTPPFAGPATRPPASAAAATIEERLRMVEDLRRRGLITDEEAKAKRRQILNSL